jgi:hypothetical protein
MLLFNGITVSFAVTSVSCQGASNAPRKGSCNCVLFWSFSTLQAGRDAATTHTDAASYIKVIFQYL